MTTDNAPKWRREKTPDRPEYRMIAGGRHIAENWYIQNLVKDTESDGWPTMAEANDFAKNILNELVPADAA